MAGASKRWSSDVRVERFPDATHWVQHDEPGRVNELLAAFLGVLTAVATRMAGLPGATAVTVLVLGWTIVPRVLAAIPAPAAQLFGSDIGLTGPEAGALAVATVAAAMTLSVPAERR